MRQLALIFTLIAASLTAYEWAAADYNRHSSGQQEWAFNFLRTVDIEGDERVLDIGCGSGLITAALAAGLPEGSAVGLDISDTMIDFAKSHFQEDNLRFVQGDGRNIPFEGEFDLIVSFNCLHWIKPLDRCFHSIQKSLRPGGQLAACIAGENPLVKAVSYTMRQAPWAEYLVSFERLPAYHSEEAITAMLQAADLKPIVVEEVIEQTPFDSREALSVWMSQWLVSEKKLPVELRAAYRDAIIDRYIQQTQTLDPVSGAITMLQNMTHVVAKK